MITTAIEVWYAAGVEPECRIHRILSLNHTLTILVKWNPYAEKQLNAVEGRAKATEKPTEMPIRTIPLCKCDCPRYSEFGSNIVRSSDHNSQNKRKATNNLRTSSGLSWESCAVGWWLFPQDQQLPTAFQVRCESVVNDCTDVK